MAEIKPQRPGVVTAAAILLLVFGSLGIIGGVCGGAGLAVMFSLDKLLPPKPANQPDVFMGIRILPKLASEAPGYVPIMVGTTAFHLILSIAGIIAGIGAFKLKPSARTVGMSVAIGMIVLNLLSSVYQMAVVQPAQNRLMVQELGVGPIPGGEASTVMTGVMLLFQVLFSAGIWLTVFFLLNSARSRDAFAGKWPLQNAEDDRWGERPRSPYAGYDDDGNPPGPPQTGITESPRNI